MYVRQGGDCLEETGVRSGPVRTPPLDAGTRDPSRRGKTIMLRTKGYRVLPLAVGVLLATASCGGDDSDKTGSQASDQPLKGVTVEVAAKWTGPEQQSFQQVLKIFERKT